MLVQIFEMFCFWIYSVAETIISISGKIFIFFIMNSFAEVCWRVEMFYLLAQHVYNRCRPWKELLTSLLVDVKLVRMDSCFDWMVLGADRLSSVVAGFLKSVVCHVYVIMFCVFYLLCYLLCFVKVSASSGLKVRPPPGVNRIGGFLENKKKQKKRQSRYGTK